MDVTSLRLFSHGRVAAGCVNVNVYSYSEVHVRWCETWEMTQCYVAHTKNGGRLGNGDLVGIRSSEVNQ